MLKFPKLMWVWHYDQNLAVKRICISKNEKFTVAYEWIGNKDHLTGNEKVANWNHSQEEDPRDKSRDFIKEIRDDIRSRENNICELVENSLQELFPHTVELRTGAREEFYMSELEEIKELLESGIKASQLIHAAINNTNNNKH